MMATISCCPKSLQTPHLPSITFSSPKISDSVIANDQQHDKSPECSSNLASCKTSHVLFPCTLTTAAMDLPAFILYRCHSQAFDAAIIALITWRYFLWSSEFLFGVSKTIYDLHSYSEHGLVRKGQIRNSLSFVTITLKYTLLRLVNILTRVRSQSVNHWLAEPSV